MENEIEKKNITVILCNFLVQTLKCLKKIAPENIKKTPSKVAHKTQIHSFFLTALTAQTAQTEEFMFQNVVYRPTVYRTGYTTTDCCLEQK